MVRKGWRAEISDGWVQIVRGPPTVSPVTPSTAATSSACRARSATPIAPEQEFSGEDIRCAPFSGPLREGERCARTCGEVGESVVGNGWHAGSRSEVALKRLREATQGLPIDVQVKQSFKRLEVKTQQQSSPPPPSDAASEVRHLWVQVAELQARLQQVHPTVPACVELIPKGSGDPDVPCGLA